MNPKNLSSITAKRTAITGKRNSQIESADGHAWLEEQRAIQKVWSQENHATGTYYLPPEGVSFDYPPEMDYRVIIRGYGEASFEQPGITVSNKFPVGENLFRYRNVTRDGVTGHFSGGALNVCFHLREAANYNVVSDEAGRVEGCMINEPHSVCLDLNTVTRTRLVGNIFRGSHISGEQRGTGIKSRGHTVVHSLNNFYHRLDLAQNIYGAGMWTSDNDRFERCKQIALFNQCRFVDITAADIRSVHVNPAIQVLGGYFRGATGALVHSGRHIWKATGSSVTEARPIYMNVDGRAIELAKDASHHSTRRPFDWNNKREQLERQVAALLADNANALARLDLD